MAHKYIPGMKPGVGTQPATVPPAGTGALLEAYLAARYEVRGPAGPAALRIGEAVPPALADALPAGRWTLLTAWNPGSRPRDDASNRQADAALQAELDALGLRRLPASSSDGSGQWHEPGWLVADLGTAGADALARRYGQAGILHWPTDGPVRLRMYLARPAGVAGSPWVDWVE